MSAPDYTDWTTERLTEQRKHLKNLLMVSAGQRDPIRPKLRDEYQAIGAELARRGPVTAQPVTAPSGAGEDQ